MSGLVPFIGADATKISVSPGTLGSMNIMTSITKSLSVWTQGSGGGLDISGSIAPNSGGHIFAIYNPTSGITDILLSGSAYNPILPPGFTQKQILNSFLTDSNGNFVQGVWHEDGNFDLALGQWPVQYENILIAGWSENYTYVHLVNAGTPRGTKLQGKFRIVLYNTESTNWGCYQYLKDPDTYPNGRYIINGTDDWKSATVDKPAGINWSSNTNVFSDEFGRLLNGSRSGTSNNFNHVYLEGWLHPREADKPTVSIGFIGASLLMDRTANNWPNVAARQLQIGKQSQVRVLLSGKEGTASNYWIANGWHTALAQTRPHIAIIDMTPDANAGQGISVAQSLANTYTMIDVLRANNPSLPIFLFKANHMRADATQFTNVLSYYANYVTVQANRSNIGIIDTYTPWGDPSLNPNEYSAGDPIHPLFSGNIRVTIPVTVASISPLVT